MKSCDGIANFVAQLGVLYVHTIMGGERLDLNKGIKSLSDFEDIERYRCGFIQNFSLNSRKLNEGL